MYVGYQRKDNEAKEIVERYEKWERKLSEMGLDKEWTEKMAPVFAGLEEAGEHKVIENYLKMIRSKGYGVGEKSNKVAEV